MDNKVNILHLSDLHFGVEPSEKRSETALAKRKNTLDALIKELKKLEAEWRPDVVVISGDIGWKGKEKDYKQAQKWLEEDFILCCRFRSRSTTSTICSFPGRGR